MLTFFFFDKIDSRFLVLNDLIFKNEHIKSWENKLYSKLPGSIIGHCSGNFMYVFVHNIWSAVVCQPPREKFHNAVTTACFSS